MAIRKPREVEISPAGTVTVRNITGVAVYAPKDRRQAAASGAFTRLGKVHTVIFSPDGARVVGVAVKRPDTVGMVARPDTFVALDSLATCDGGLRVTRGKDAYDRDACERLGIDYDACIIWVGMDVKTLAGRKLGYVEDAEFAAWEGTVTTYGVGDGNTAKSLVGRLEIPRSMVVRYQDGYMIVDDQAAKLALSGGLAAKAGEGYAKAKIAGKDALERGRERQEQATEAATTAVSEGSKALGKQLGRTRGMFGAFMSEYKKASGKSDE